MRFASVCSGIEAASVAWYQFGWRAAWLSEIDKAASDFLAYRFPEVPNLGDMTQIAPLIDLGMVEAPDVLVGGTPCQGFSVAGRRGGLSDPRGQLTLSFVEIADAIDSARRAAGQPECIITWENVPGVLSMRDNAFGNFLAALAGEDVPLEPSGKRWPDAGVVLGPKRTIAWRILDAQFFGLAQRRKRVFVVASARDGFDPGEVLLEFDGVRRDSPPSRETREDSTHPLAPRLTGSGRGIERTGDTRGQDPVVAVGHRLTNHVSPKAFGGGNCSGPIAAAALNANERYDFDSETFIVEPTIYQDSEFGIGEYPTAGALRAGRIPEHQMVLEPQCVTGDCTQDLSPTLRAGGHSDSHANGGVMPAVAYSVALRGRDGGATAELGEDLANALRTGGGGGDKPHVLSNMAVRRLMPVECERLQGFPDGWTRIPVRFYKRRRITKLRPEDMWERDENGGWWLMSADGPRYKQLGNSMATHCMAWIGWRIHSWLAFEPVRAIIG